ncbi:MAG: serine/threonine-protein kinase, partial [Gemmataceae bacterium]
RSKITGDIVAIKIVPSETAKNPVLLKRFEQEFKAASLLDHPNVVKAIEYCGTGTNPFLVMEFVDGESLGGRVDRDGAIGDEEALAIMTQVCEGLHRAHKQGLIHRDVKPDNILVTKEGVAKLTDMGLVKEVEGELNLTRTGRGLGTPHFMAPEQFRNAKNADVRCDVYSLGATLYMVVTGEVPFAKTSPLDCWMKKMKNDFPHPKTLNPRVSDRVNWAILRAMSADPNQRAASCREFMEDLTGAAWKTQRMQIPVEVAMETSGAPVMPANTPDLWYLVYKDKAGQSHTVKGSTESIRQNIGSGALGDANAVMVCRTKTGQFMPLRTIPEFRDMVIAPAPVVPPGKPSRDKIPAAPATPAVTPKKRSTSQDPQSGVITRNFPALSGQQLPQVQTGGKNLVSNTTLIYTLIGMVGVLVATITYLILTR